jgi:hypothetical protein
MNKPIEDFYQWLKSKWFEKQALILSFILLFLIFIATFRLSSIYDVTFWILYICLSASLLVGWLKNRSKYKRSKGKIGIVIGAKTQDTVQYSKIRYDLIDKLKKELDIDRYQIIELPFPWVTKINSDKDMEKCLYDTDAHILLLCRSSEGKMNGKEKYQLEISSIVRHFSIDEEDNQKIASELGELTFDFEIDKDDDLMHFKLTSNWLSVYTEYFIGLAAFVSEDVYTSIEIYEDLLTKIMSYKNSIKPIKTIRNKTHDNLAYLYEILTLHEYRLFWKSKNFYHLEKTKEYSDKMYKYGFNLYSYSLLESIYVFLKYRDTIRARQILKQVEQEKDGSHWFSNAFLYAYEGKVFKAKSCYEKAQKLPNENQEVLFEIEEFVEYILELEKDKYYLYLSLAYINIFKGDYALAKDDLEQFIAYSSTKEKDAYAAVIDDLSKLIGQNFSIMQAV